MSGRHPTHLEYSNNRDAPRCLTSVYKRGFDFVMRDEGRLTAIGKTFWKKLSDLREKGLKALEHDNDAIARQVSPRSVLSAAPTVTAGERPDPSHDLEYSDSLRQSSLPRSFS